MEYILVRPILFCAGLTTSANHFLQWNPEMTLNRLKRLFGQYKCFLAAILVPFIVYSISYYQRQSTISVFALKNPHWSIPAEDKHNTHHHNRLLCAGAACIALLIGEHRTVFPVLICRGDDRQKCPCCVWQLTMVPDSPLLWQIAEEVDVLLWLFPPGVTSQRMRISAGSSLIHTLLLCVRIQVRTQAEGHGPVFPRCDPCGWGSWHSLCVWS